MKTERFTVATKEYDIAYIAYLPHSEKAESVTLCLHGFGGDKDSSAVKKLGKALSEKNCATVCFDFAAHGESPLDSSFLTVENCVTHAKAVCDYIENRFGGKKINFFATSFGAYILLNMLSKFSYPEAKILLRSPAVKMEDTFLFPICNMTETELIENSKVVCGFERKMELDHTFYLDLKAHSLDNAKVTNKALMIYGSADDVVRPEDMESFAKRNNIETFVIDGADHRFKKAGELDEVIRISAEFLI